MWTHIRVRPHITFPHKVILRLVVHVFQIILLTILYLYVYACLSVGNSQIYIYGMMTSANGTFSALLAICAGNSPVNSRHKGQWCGALMFSLICAWINGWVNNERLVIWDAIAPIMTSLKWFHTSTGMPNHWEGINPIWPSDATYQQIWITSGSANDLLPDDTKPLPGSVGTYQ